MSKLSKIFPPYENVSQHCDALVLSPAREYITENSLTFRQKISNFISGKKSTSLVNLFTPVSVTGEKLYILPYEATTYFLQCCPVATAIDKIAEEVASIQPLIYDKKSEKYINSHPILDLLDSPDADMTFTEFMYQLAAWYLMTGNVYIKGGGFVGKLPISLRIYPSPAVSVVAGSDGYAQNFLARFLGVMDSYTREIIVLNNRERFRFYDTSKFKEMYHIKRFTTQSSSNMVYGLSPLNSVYYAMRQYVDASIFNMNLLQRGSRFSGVFTAPNNMPDETRQRLQEQINVSLSGAHNAGRNILLSNGVEYEDAIKSPRDMEYNTMKLQVTNEIYNVLKIPLPLISSDHMTYSNVESANYTLYKQAVIPLAKRLYKELSNFLMFRFDPRNTDLSLAFSLNSIPQLEPERNEQMKSKKDSGIYTVNELRADVGKEPLEGGQFIYGAMGATPIATDPSDKYYIPGSLSVSDETSPTTQEIKQPEKEVDKNEDAEIEESEEEKKSMREKFISVLKKQVNRDGSSRFSDEDIDELVAKHYGE